MEIQYRRRREEGKIAAGMSGKVTGNHTINYLPKKEIYNTCRFTCIIHVQNTCIVGIKFYHLG